MQEKSNDIIEKQLYIKAELKVTLQTCVWNYFTMGITRIII